MQNPYTLNINFPVKCDYRIWDAAEREREKEIW